MKINFIKYAQSIRSDGGDIRFEAAAVLDKNESPDVAFHDLKNYVQEKLGLKEWAPSNKFTNTPKMTVEKPSGE